MGIHFRYPSDTLIGPEDQKNAALAIKARANFRGKSGLGNALASII